MHVGCTVTAKGDGFKGMKPPVKIEMHVPILNNGNVIEAGQTITGPKNTINGRPKAKSKAKVKVSLAPAGGIMAETPVAETPPTPVAETTEDRTPAAIPDEAAGHAEASGHDI